MFDLLLAIAFFAIQIYALIDVARSPEGSVRTLPKWAWIIIVIIFGALGGLGWFIAGRTSRPSGVNKIRPSTRKIIPPDDNDEFLRQI
jgi:hypothetical protein